MEHIILIFFLGIVFFMVIAAITSAGQRRPKSHLHYDTTDESNFSYFSSDDTHHFHHHSHDHGNCSDFSHGDSGSCHSSGCDGGGGGCD